MARLALCLVIVSAATSILAEEHRPFFAYRTEGGLSSYKALSVNIDGSGRTHAVLEKAKRIQYETLLATEELETLRSLIRATDFFSQPDKDTEFATDTGLSEITVCDADHSRTLKFAYRPGLQPIETFVRKIFAQAEAWQALQAGDPCPAMTALVNNYATPKLLQPSLFKKPLMEFLRAAREDRKIACGLEALTAITTPEEFSGFVWSQTGVRDQKSLLLRSSANYPKSHQLALCPIYLAFLRDNYPHWNDFNGADNKAGFLLSRLAESRYEPAIPYLLGLFDEQRDSGWTSPLAALAELGRPCLYSLVARLNNANEAQRVNVMEVLTIAFRNNSKNPVPNAVSDYEFAEMGKDFERFILPKLTLLSQKDPSEIVRQKAAGTIDQIRTELTKTDGIGGSFVKLELMPDHKIRRTLLENEKDKTVSWHVIKDGKAISQHDAKERSEFKHPDETSGVYTVYVSVWSKGEYRVISNLISYKIEGPPTQ